VQSCQKLPAVGCTFLPKAENAQTETLRICLRFSQSTNRGKKPGGLRSRPLVPQPIYRQELMNIAPDRLRFAGLIVQDRLMVGM